MYLYNRTYVLFCQYQYNKKTPSFKDAFHATWNVRVEIPKPGKSERKDSNLRLGHKPLLYQLSYVPRGRQQAFACCLVGFNVSRQPYAFGFMHATIISRKYPFVVTHFFIFLSGAFLSFPLNHTVCICHRKHER